MFLEESPWFALPGQSGFLSQSLCPELRMCSLLLAATIPPHSPSLEAQTARPAPAGQHVSSLLLDSVAPEGTLPRCCPGSWPAFQAPPPSFAHPLSHLAKETSPESHSSELGFWWPHHMRPVEKHRTSLFLSHPHPLLGPIWTVVTTSPWPSDCDPAAMCSHRAPIAQGRPRGRLPPGLLWLCHLCSPSSLLALLEPTVSCSQRRIFLFFPQLRK